jgi:DNA gyrase subunit B
MAAALNSSPQNADAFAWSDEQARRIITEHGLMPEEDAIAARQLAETNGKAAPIESDDKPLATIRELHENKELAPIIVQLSDLGIDIDDYGLVQEEAVTGEKLPTKYAWVMQKKQAASKETERSDSQEDSDEESAPESPSAKIIEAASIPDILATLRELGRRGMEVKRFKGLGEMDPEQLWETTMDFEKRTLMRVTWDQGEAADELFTTLMGENVEQRRNYIEKHALEVKQLDV